MALMTDEIQKKPDHPPRGGFGRVDAIKAAEEKSTTEGKPLLSMLMATV